MGGLNVPLRAAARAGRWLLVAGLAAGIALPDIAAAMKPWLPELVGFLLFLAALRIGPRAALGALSDLRAVVGVALIYQLVLPVATLTAALAAGIAHLPLATALVLMLSAPSISGSPNLTVLTGNDPTPALRILILGTAILPLTVLPVLWLSPALGTPAEVLGAAARLLLVIALAAAAGFALRSVVMPAPSRAGIEAIDGLSAVAMAVIVVGLMAAVRPALEQQPDRFLLWLSIAFAANFGLQIAAAAILRRSPLAAQRVPLAIVAGNRNIALFLAALPATVTDPILLFIGCYQFPMYLTPILLRRLFRAPDPESP
ncbi:MAG: hypothetical protein ACK4KW_13055 [Gemmobacter sp.]